MRETTLLVVVIETPNSSRSVPLISTLEGDSRFELVRLSAVMLNSDLDIVQNDIKLNRSQFKLFHGREMSPREVGCAHSHNLARALLSNSTNGGVVLEDDARINNIDSFFKSASDFLLEHRSEPAVLSLNDFRPGKNLGLKRDGIQRLFGTPFLAVAYASTSLAASELFKANSPIRTVSDWPRSPITYYATYDPTVLHGDSEVLSTINIDGNLSRNGKTLNKKIADILFFSFFSNRQYAISFKDYLNEIYWSRITWRLDLVKRLVIRAIYQ